MTEVLQSIFQQIDKQATTTEAAANRLRDERDRRDAEKKSQTLGIEAQEIQVSQQREQAAVGSSAFPAADGVKGAVTTPDMPSRPVSPTPEGAYASPEDMQRQAFYNQPGGWRYKVADAMGDGIVKGGASILDLGIDFLNFALIGNRNDIEFSFYEKLPEHVKDNNHGLGYDLLEGISQFAVGWQAAAPKLLPFYKSLKDGGKGARLAADTYRGAIADLSAFKGTDANLADLVQKVPALENPLTEYLGNENKGSEQETLGRVHNAIVGGVVGSVLGKAVDNAANNGIIDKAKNFFGRKPAQNLTDITAESKRQIEEAAEAVGDKFVNDLIGYKAARDVADNINADGSLDDVGLESSVKGSPVPESLPEFAVRRVGDDTEYYRNSVNGEFSITQIKVGNVRGGVFLPRDAFEGIKTDIPALPNAYVPQFIGKTLRNPAKVLEFKDGHRLYVKEYDVGEPHNVLVKPIPDGFEVVSSKFGVGSMDDVNLGKAKVVQGTGRIKPVVSEANRLRAVQVLSKRLSELTEAEEAIKLRVAGDSAEVEIKSLLQNKLRNVQSNKAELERLLRGMSKVDADAVPMLTQEEGMRLSDAYKAVRSAIDEVIGEGEGVAAKADDSFIDGIDSAIDDLPTQADVADGGVLPFGDDLPKFNAKDTAGSVEAITQHITQGMRKVADGDIDMLAMLEATSRHLGKANGGKGPAISNAMTEAQAYELGIEQKQWEALRDKAQRSSAEMMAMQINLKAATRNAIEAAEDLAELGFNATEADKLRYRKAQALQMAAQYINMDMRSAYGRTLQVLKNNVEPTAEAYRKIAGSMKRTDEDAIDDLGDNLESMLNEAKNIVALGRLSESELTKAFSMMRREPRWWDYIFEWRYFAMLSGPETHATNIKGNFAMFAMHSIESSVAGVIAPAVKGADNKVADGLQYFAYGLRGLPEALAAGVDAFKLNRTTGRYSDDLGKIEDQAQHIKGPVGAVVSLPGRLLSAEDEFFKALNYNANLNLQIRKEALRQTESSPAKFMEMFWDNKNQSDVMNKLRNKIAMDSAKLAAVNTFTSASDNAAVKMLQAWSYDIPLIRVFMPFIRTPFNLIEQAALRTPYAVLAHPFPMLRMNKFKAAIDAGGNEKALALSRVALGTTLGTMIYSLVDGESAGDSGDYRVSALQRAMEGQPHAFKIGDKKFEYGRLEPLGLIIAMAADLKRLQNVWENEEDPDVIALAAGYALTVSDYIGDKTVLQGVSDFMDLAINRDRGAVSKYASQQIKTLIPAAINQSQRLTGADTFIYDTKQADWWSSAYSAVMAKLGAGNATNQAVKMDFFGKPRQVSGGIQRLFNLSDVPKRTDAEMRVFDFFKLRDWVPTDPARTYSAKYVSVDLPAQAYNEILAIRNEGDVMTKALDKIIKREDFQAASEEVQKSMVQKVMKGFTERAKGIYFKENPWLRRELEAEIKNFMAKQGRQ